MSLDIVCPICNGPTKQLFQKKGYWIQECKACRHRFVDHNPSIDHVARTYGDHYFFGGMDGYPNYLDEAEILTEHGREYAKIIGNFTEPGKMLDVGCAAGFILKGFQEFGWDGYGLEPNSRMAEYARNNLGLTVETNSLERYQNNLQFDLITMIQVLPHLYDIRNALQVAAEITRPGGFWLIETWNKDSFVARMFGQNWHEYSPPSVLHWFSHHGLKSFAEKYDFIEIAYGRPSKRINGKHAKTILNHKLEELFSAKFTNSLLEIIPDQQSIPYPAFDLFWTIYQKE